MIPTITLEEIDKFLLEEWNQMPEEFKELCGSFEQYKTIRMNPIKQ